MSAEKAPARFNPGDHLRQLRGKGGTSEYLEVKWRLVWLRQEHPDAAIASEKVEGGIESNYAVFKARVSIPGGGSATGWGSETKADFGDFLEKAECLEQDAEILTRRGFQIHTEARIGEEVLAYDLTTDTCRWVPLEQIGVYPNRVSYALGNNAGWAVRGTSDHKWAVLDCNGQRLLRPAEDLRASDRIILAAPAPSGDSPITPREAAILGWIVTDGSIRRQGNCLNVTITQSKPETVALLRELLGTEATDTVTPARERTFPSGRTYPCLPQHTFRLPSAVSRALFAKAGIAGRKDLPALACRLSGTARAAMLDAMMLADGDKRGNFGKKRHPAVMEAWQILCTLQGIALAPLRLRSNSQPVQRAKKRRYLCSSQLTLRDGGPRVVWCPTTMHGTWIFRQNGVVAITGNTKAIGRALAALGYGTQFAPELDEGDGIADSPVERTAGGGRQAKGKPADAFTWDDLWPWAKARGINDRKSLDEALGRDTKGMTPQQLYIALRARESAAKARRSWTVDDALVWLQAEERTLQKQEQCCEWIFGQADDAAALEALVQRVTPLVHQDARDAAWRGRMLALGLPEEGAPAAEEAAAPDKRSGKVAPDPADEQGEPVQPGFALATD